MLRFLAPLHFLDVQKQKYNLNKNSNLTGEELIEKRLLDPWKDNARQAQTDAERDSEKPHQISWQVLFKLTIANSTQDMCCNFSTIWGLLWKVHPLKNVCPHQKSPPGHASLHSLQNCGSMELQKLQDKLNKYVINKLNK